MNCDKFPVKVIFYKKGEMIYFSQLDIFHLLEKALRRTNLPLYFTKGFNSHVKISFPYALKLGIQGQIEATLYFSEKVSAADLEVSLSVQLPSGLEITQAVNE